MTTINSTNASAPAVVPKSAPSGMAALDGGDFMKLMTVQLQNQDPFNPVDNTEMLAQMAQFTQLANSSEMASTLQQIRDRLDLLAPQSSTDTIQE